MTDRPSLLLVAALYPFGAGAAAVNIFFASVITSWLGWEVMTPYAAAGWGLLLGAPVTWLFARHITRLMNDADDTDVLS